MQRQARSMERNVIARRKINMKTPSKEAQSQETKLIGQRNAVEGIQPLDSLSPDNTPTHIQDADFITEDELK